jgi:uncharacterized protein
MAVIARTQHIERVCRLLRDNPVVGILGARQVGKTTLAKQVAAGRRVTFFDLEDPGSLAALNEPMLALSGLRGLVVLDEIQRRPDLFPVLRVLADRPRPPARFLVLGSAAPELLRQSSETLAGRIAFHELPGLSLAEVGADHLDRLWFRGGFPRSYVARSHGVAAEWRTSFIRTFLEREVLPLGVDLPPATMERFWAMIAHYHGQIWNASELGRSFGISHTSVAKYLDVLTGTFVVEQLRPWHENAGKRLVKAPKIFIADSGLLHSLLDISTPQSLLRHPKLGASWEGFVLAELRKHLGVDRRQCWFWATHGGAELDLLVVKGGRRYGFEVKRTSSPTITPSIRSAIADLKLEHVTVIHAGDKSFPLANNVAAVSVHAMLDEIKPLRS